MQGGDREPKVLVSAVLTPDRINKRQNGRRFKNIDEPEFTLTGQDRHGVLLDNGKFIAIRKLTPKECWRLQGFSDEQFEKAKEAGVSDCQLYKQAGNAVTVPVIEQIGKRLEVIGE
ncbi:modification methylase Rho11sI family protein [Lactobacillus hominis DSM 23910 = CRBIP 24.179]|nr:modification methylase Rho11sI family protein [Lactobacillus hominis DSM 23910 = CRBIP 24.179]